MPTPRLPPEDHRKETWRPVNGFDKYEVSNFGRVRRETTKSYTRRFGPNNKPWKQVVKYKRLMTPTKYTDKDHLYVRLTKDGEQVPLRLDRLVADTFCSIPEGAKILFKDDNPLNCAAENLTYRRTKLTETKVRNIKRFMAQGHSIKDLARRYRVDRQTIRKIRDGKLWRHVYVTLD